MNLDDAVTEHLRRDVRPLRADTTVETALAALRGAILPERIVYFYVEDADRRLTGVVPTRRLLAAEKGATVGSCMVGDVVSLPATATLREASEAFLRHRLLALPVVDDAGRLAGTIDISLFSDELVAGQGHQAIDDVFQTIGVHVARDRQAGPWGAFRDRFPWLLSNIGGGLLCAVLVSRYERFLDVAIVLALFMPVVLALAESVSIQSMTLTLQALHAGVPSAGALARSLARDLATALLLGGASGTVVSLVVWLWRADLSAAAVIGGTILSAVVTACLLGVLLPTAVRALRLDPKLAAGPITLALTDVGALLFYFAIGTRLLG
jgi:magnesium transporter